MQKLLDAVSTVGAGSAYRVGDGQRVNFLDKYTIQWHAEGLGVNTLDALTIVIRGSIDGVHYNNELASYIASATELTNLEGMFHIVNEVVNYVKAEITTLTVSGGTAQEITVMFSPTFLRSL